MNNEIPDVILVGGGGHALSLMEFAPHWVTGYVARTPSDSIKIKWMGDDSVAPELISQGYAFNIAFVYSGLPILKKRKEIIEYYKKLGAKFHTLIAPSAIVTPNSDIGPGSSLMTGCIVNRASLGENVIVNSGAIVEHDCTIGNNSFIGPGAVIGGAVEIGENCFIGLGALIKNGVKVCSNVSVAMGAIVDRDLLEPGIYHGTPLRCHRIRS